MRLQGIASTVAILAAAGVTFAEVTFKVIAYPEDNVSKMAVSISGQLTELHTDVDTFPLWTGTVATASSGTHYKYVQITAEGTIVKSEAFERSVSESATETLNEFFDREITKAVFPKVPQVGPDVRPEPSLVFDDTQIATIHVQVSEEKFASMVTNPRQNDEQVSANFFYLNADFTYRVQGVTLKLAGKSSRGFKKLAFKFKFDKKKGQKFFGRPSVKLRAQNYDPTYMREKLYFDVLNAAGIHSAQGAWVRLFINNRPWGFYLMIDDIGKPFLRYNVHHEISHKAQNEDHDDNEGDEEKIKLGSLYQMAAPAIPLEADLQYYGPRAEDYPPATFSNHVVGDNPKDAPMTQLIQFIKRLHDFDPKQPGAIAFWNQYLDLDEFLLCMAIEFLGASWDGYWWDGSNYFMYFNPTIKGGAEGGKWQWIPTDFDSTFGDGDPALYQTTYQFYANMTKHDHPLVSKLILLNRDIQAKFEQILYKTVTQLFTPKALFGKIDAYEKFIARDAEWDLTLDRSYYREGKVLGYTIGDFHGSISGSIRGIRIGIKPWIYGRARDVPGQLTNVVAKRSMGPEDVGHEQVNVAVKTEAMTSSVNSAQTLLSGSWSLILLGAVAMTASYLC
ncbi:spore coat protein H [Entomortierella parvispora]|uniref:Spore coat protein H n=1 Tax=Entomortierella parvispora TaxID=205924 RepID=A0A9P3H1X1_9FUNG|nr:spore coat protein H [Entomortierella parvispora]